MNLKNLREILKRPRVYIPVSSLIIIFLIIVGLSGSGDEEASSRFIIERINLESLVSVSGVVKSISEVDLAFEQSGKISSINTSVGTRVSRGQVLASLNNAVLLADLEGAEANLEVEEIKLLEMKRGTRSEEIDIARTKRDNARRALEDTHQKLNDTLGEIYAKTDNAVNNVASKLFSNADSNNPVLNFTVDNRTKFDLELKHLGSRNKLTSWQEENLKLDLSTNTSIAEGEAENTLVYVEEYLSNLVVGVINSNLSSSNKTTHQSNLSIERTTINNAISDLSSSQEGVRSSESSLSLAERELSLDEAGNTPEAIRIQEAQVKSKRAIVNKFRAQIGERIIISPISGIVTVQDGTVGEIIAANTQIISVISDSKFKLEANIPEADITGVSVGDVARLSLDAYGDDILFSASVIAIDPAETIIEGVSTYKTTFDLLDNEHTARSGMSANIDIITNKREAVLAVPARAIVREEGKTFILVVSSPRDSSFTLVEVSLGILSSEGLIEIESSQDLLGKEVFTSIPE